MFDDVYIVVDDVYHLSDDILTLVYMMFYQFVDDVFIICLTILKLV
jgi:hypothetical protein